MFELTAIWTAVILRPSTDIHLISFAASPHYKKVLGSCPSQAVLWRVAGDSVSVLRWWQSSVASWPRDWWTTVIPTTPIRNKQPVREERRGILKVYWSWGSSPRIRVPASYLTCVTVISPVRVWTASHNPSHTKTTFKTVPSELETSSQFVILLLFGLLSLLPSQICSLHTLLGCQNRSTVCLGQRLTQPLCVVLFLTVRERRLLSGGGGILLFQDECTQYSKHPLSRFTQRWAHRHKSLPWWAERGVKDMMFVLQPEMMKGTKAEQRKDHTSQHQLHAGLLCVLKVHRGSS